MTKPKQILYIDMDGVLCDYNKAHSLAVSDVLGMTYPQCQMDFFRRLEPIKNALDSIQMLSDYYDVYILSSPSTKNPLSYTEKMLWVKDHLGKEFVERLILSKHKHLNKGDFLVDDRPDYNGAGDFEGKLVHFGSKKFKNWRVTYDYLIKKYKEYVRS